MNNIYIKSIINTKNFPVKETVPEIKLSNDYKANYVNISTDVNNISEILFSKEGKTIQVDDEDEPGDIPIFTKEKGKDGKFIMNKDNKNYMLILENINQFSYCLTHTNLFVASSFIMTKNEPCFGIFTTDGRCFDKCKHYVDTYQSNENSYKRLKSSNDVKNIGDILTGSINSLSKNIYEYKQSDKDFKEFFNIKSAKIKALISSSGIKADKEDKEDKEDKDTQKIENKIAEVNESAIRLYEIAEDFFSVSNYGRLNVNKVKDDIRELKDDPVFYKGNKNPHETEFINAVNNFEKAYDKYFLGKGVAEGKGLYQMFLESVALKKVMGINEIDNDVTKLGLYSSIFEKIKKPYETLQKLRIKSGDDEYDQDVQREENNEIRGVLYKLFQRASVDKDFSDSKFKGMTYAEKKNLARDYILKDLRDAFNDPKYNNSNDLKEFFTIENFQEYSIDELTDELFDMLLNSLIRFNLLKIFRGSGKNLEDKILNSFSDEQMKDLSILAKTNKISNALREKDYTGKITDDIINSEYRAFVTDRSTNFVKDSANLMTGTFEYKKKQTSMKDFLKALKDTTKRISHEIPIIKNQYGDENKEGTIIGDAYLKKKKMEEVLKIELMKCVSLGVIAKYIIESIVSNINIYINVGSPTASSEITQTLQIWNEYVNYIRRTLMKELHVDEEGNFISGRSIDLVNLEPLLLLNILENEYIQELYDIRVKRIQDGLNKRDTYEGAKNRNRREEGPDLTYLIDEKNQEIEDRIFEKKDGSYVIAISNEENANIIKRTFKNRIASLTYELYNQINDETDSKLSDIERMKFFH